jgi:hypothetical protein
MRHNERPAAIKRLAAATAIVGLLSVSAMAAEPKPLDAAFVASFAATCIPEHLSYEGTRAAAVADGWAEIPEDAHPDLAEMMRRLHEVAASPAYATFTWDFSTYSKLILERPYYLIVQEFVGPEPMHQVGCMIYDFAATEIVDPELFAKLFDAPILYTSDKDGMLHYTFGAAPALPGARPAMLALVRPGSKHAQPTGFAGMNLQFSSDVPGEN